MQTEAIEPEKGNEQINIEIPFNPNDIKVRTMPLNIGDLIERLSHGEIKMDTAFQRLPHLWNTTQKSRFIESLILSIPIPSFYFDGQDDNLWQVIDGLQRISTLEHFIFGHQNKKLRLQNLEFLKEYEGCLYEELPRMIQRRIKTFPITAYILEKGTPDAVKFNIFKRINQSGLILTPQEIRHAIHQGVASTTVAELVSADTEAGAAFLRATNEKISPKRMEDRDFATRFVAFYLIPYTKYQPDLDSFMNEGLVHLKKLSAEGLQKLKEDFTQAMQTAFAIFGDEAFRKRFNMEEPKKPINKSLFDSLSVNFAQITTAQVQHLILHQKKFKLFRYLQNYEKYFILAV
ncbi:MAG: DUF262 domain-containing protein [Bernardetiaceae bacterium]|nr:DUF262 domain-containing protein [Bernardetiaceae bacterium]